MILIVEDIIKLEKNWLEDNYKKRLKKYNIKYDEIKEYIFIKKQKIQLKEEDINILFYEILQNTVKIEYTRLGNEKSKLSFSIYKD